MIEIKNVALQIDDTPILKGFSTTIKHPSVTTIIGPNGAGKTSLVRSILRLVDEWSGSITLNGVDIRSLTSVELAQQISYVPQNIPASHTMSVEQFVALSRYPWLNRWQPLSLEDKQIIHAALTTAGVDSLRHRSVTSLSGGERQLTAIAAALAQNTPLIIMDEPASNLDPLHSYTLYRLAEKIVKNEDKTVVIVTHDITAALRHSDKLILLKEGLLFFEGTPSEVANSEQLQQLFGISFSVLTDKTGNIVVFPEGVKDE